MSLLLTYLAIAIGISFLCSVLEAVLLSISPSYVESVTVKHPKRGKVLYRIRDRLDQSIASILILNTFAHTIMIHQNEKNIDSLLHFQIKICWYSRNTDYYFIAQYELRRFILVCTAFFMIQQYFSPGGYFALWIITLLCFSLYSFFMIQYFLS